VDNQSIQIVHSSIGFGLTQVTAYRADFIGPVGVMWGIHMGRGNASPSAFDIIHVYTLPAFRRHGVARAMFDYLLDSLAVDVVRTPDGSKDGGLACLRGCGFVRSREAGVWHLSRSRRREMNHA
jgi:ribosomal protein S18 acetylase RimI-like enzyme